MTIPPVKISFRENSHKHHCHSPQQAVFVAESCFTLCTLSKTLHLFLENRIPVFISFCDLTDRPAGISGGNDA